MWLLRILVFFPSITFSLLTAEIFPWALLAVCYNKILVLSKSINPLFKGMQKKFLPLLILLVLSSLFAFLFSLYQGLKADSLRSFFAYINPLVIYIYLLNCTDKEIQIYNNIIGKILLFYIILGFFQSIGIINFLTPIFRFLISRGSAVSLLDIGGRGVNLLTNEPSHAAFDLIFIYITWTYLQIHSKVKELFYDFFIFIFLLLIIRSATGIMIFGLYLLFKYRLKLALLLMAILSLVLPFIFEIIERSAGRAIEFIYSLLLTSSLEELFRLLLIASGNRLISQIASYKYIFINPFGGGIGLWTYSSLDALNSIDIISPKEIWFFDHGGGGNFIAVRPSSYMASIALDMGFLGIGSVLYMLKPIFFLLKKITDDIFPLTACFIFVVLLYSSPGQPIHWVCMALAYRSYIKMKNSKKHINGK
jgi:hypothetical protein